MDTGDVVVITGQVDRAGAAGPLVLAQHRGLSGGATVGAKPEPAEVGKGLHRALALTSQDRLAADEVVEGERAGAGVRGSWLGGDTDVVPVLDVGQPGHDLAAVDVDDVELERRLTGDLTEQLDAEAGEPVVVVVVDQRG